MHLPPTYILLLGLTCFLLVGTALGLLGGGGSILSVPVLVQVLGLPASIAVPMSLPIVGITAAVGAGMRRRQHNLAIRPTVVFAAVTMAAAFAAALLGGRIPDRTRVLLLVLVMISAAVIMWRRSRAIQAMAVTAEYQAETRPLHARYPHLIITGIIVGTITGVTGVGGGFLVVPALTGVLGLSLPVATATSLTVIALNTLAAGIGSYGRVEIDPVLTVLVTVAALVGMVFGTRMAPQFSVRNLTRGFSVLLIVVSMVMLRQALKL